MTNNEIDRLHDVYQKHIDDSETAPLKTNELLGELNDRLSTLEQSLSESESINGFRFKLNILISVMAMLAGIVAAFCGIISLK